MLKTDTRPKYNSVQLLRFIAALMVIVLHSTFYASERLAPGLPLYNEGSSGVALFFAISGFVMIISSQGLVNKEGAWKTFGLRRVIRIVPIYWIINSYKLIILLGAAVLVRHAVVDSLFIVKSYLFVPAINVDGKFSPFYGVGWTLNFEMFFYLLFTVALLIRANPIILLAPIFIALTILAFYRNYSWGALYFYADPIVLFFLYGMILAQLMLKGIRIPDNISLGMIIVTLVFLFIPRPAIPDYLFNFLAIGKHVAVFLLLYAALSIDAAYGHKIPNWLIYLGGASYSLYLIHPSVAPFPPMALDKIHLKWPVISIILSILLALAAGTLFYKYCEQPITDRLTRWSKKVRLLK
jgi:peptidoglycan/LPS O-acetylase OafA/YrhL